MNQGQTHSLDDDPFAVEGTLASGAKGIAPDAGQQDPDSEWQPL